MSDQNKQATGPEGTIPVNEAIILTQNWRTFIKNGGKDFNVNAFLIPIIDFKNILKYNPDAESVRAYIGLENENDPMSGKLILVPVVNEKDVLYVTAENGSGLDGENESNVYDLTKTCPPICADDSPLNG